MDEKERMKALVSQAKMGDAHSFATLYEMLYLDLYRAALYTLGNPDDAENVVSDTVMDAYSGLTKLRDDSAFRGWIFKILDNKCKKYLKEYIHRREVQSAVPVEDMAETLPSNGNVIQGAENRTMIQDAFSVLNEEEKRIVTMTVYGQYDSGEIATMMGINRNTVRSKYSRALLKMRNRLGGQA